MVSFTYLLYYFLFSVIRRTGEERNTRVDISKGIGYVRVKRRVNPKILEFRCQMEVWFGRHFTDKWCNRGSSYYPDYLDG